MGTINKAILIGNLGKDPEISTLESGMKIARFSLATSEKFKKRDGEMEEKTQWHNIRCFKTLAELAEKYLKKGSMLYVEGRIEYSEYEGKWYTNIIALNISFMGGKREEKKKEEPIPEPDEIGDAIESDDLPF